MYNYQIKQLICTDRNTQGLFFSNNIYIKQLNTHEEANLVINCLIFL